MICPKCKDGEVKEQISIKGVLFWKKKKVITFCPLCDFRNEHIFELSQADKEIELADRQQNVGLERVKLNNTKTKIIDKKSKYDEKREYNYE